MIGIDVVDLSDPLLRKRDKQHLRFILHPEDEPSSNEAFWSLWAAKEAVFKSKRVIQKFNPKLIPIQFRKDNKRNKLHFSSGQKMEGFVKIGFDYVLSVAFRRPENVFYDIQINHTNNPSSEIRNFMERWYHKMFGTKVDIVSNSNELPMVQETDEVVSFSHHGRYMAFGLKKN